MEEKILEESFSDGGEYELECTIELYGHSLLRYCHNILCDYHKAQDVVQVTFIKAYNKRKSFKKGYSLSAWLYSIAYNTCMDVLRKNRRRKILFFIPEVRINTVDSSTDFMSEDLKKALLKLTGAERALIFSRIMDEKSYKELEIIYQVSAATIPSFNKVISIVSPEIAYMLQPIGKSSEDNGIKMEVVAAYNDDEMAVLYLTMQDLIGDRIGESIDLYNYSLSKGSMFNAQVIDYDKASKTATLRIQVNGGERMDGKRLYLSVSSFLGHFQEFNEVVTGITLSDIKKVNSETIPLDTEYVSGVSGDLFFTEWEERGVIQVLKGDQKKILLTNIDFMYISNIGYIGDKLHIQTKWVGNGKDDHGYFYFTDTENNKLDINPSTVHFGIDESGNTKDRGEYIEYFFDLKDIDTKEALLKGYFVSSDEYIEGDWKVKFKLQSVKEQKEARCKLDFGTWKGNHIYASQLGVTLLGTGEYDGNHPKIHINMIDGTTRDVDFATSFDKEGKIYLKYLTKLPVDSTMIESLSINGKQVKLR